MEGARRGEAGSRMSNTAWRRRKGGTMGDDPAYLVRYGLDGSCGTVRARPDGPGAAARSDRRDPDRSGRGSRRGPGSCRQRRLDKPGEARDRERRPGSSPADRRPDPDRPGLLAGRPGRSGACAEVGNARHEQFAVCRRILEEGGWPLELIDVETLLDLSTTVLHVLGSARSRPGPPPRPVPQPLRFRRGLRARRFGILPRPRGGHRTTPREGRGRCGDCDCSGGGCGTITGEASASRRRHGGREPDLHRSSCVDSAHSACSSCGYRSGWPAKADWALPDSTVRGRPVRLVQYSPGRVGQQIEDRIDSGPDGIEERVAWYHSLKRGLARKAYLSCLAAAGICSGPIGRPCRGPRPW